MEQREQSVQVTCPQCGATLLVKNTGGASERKVNCPKCQQPISVNFATAEPPAHLAPPAPVPPAPGPTPSVAPMQPQSSGKNKAWLIGLLSALVLALAGVLVWFLLHKDKPKYVDDDDDDDVVTEMTASTDISGVEMDEETMIYSVSDDGTLNIRQSPSANSPIVGKLITGGKGARLIETYGSWYKVQFGDVTGFVNSRYASTQPDASLVATPSDSRTIYYVVIGSYSSLASAKAARNYLPDGIDCSPIFIGYKDGKTYYRVCSGMYYSKTAAKEEVDMLSSYYSLSPWIWPSSGSAQCADRPLGYNGTPVSITPER